MIIDTSTALSYGTDPIAAGVRRALATHAFVAADRDATPPPASATAESLDIDWLYPTLGAPLAHIGVSARIASIAAAVASFVAGRSPAPAVHR